MCRYLEDTQKRGLMLSITRKLRVDCYVDSDFAVLFSYEGPHDLVYAISQSRYIVTFNKCPILWVSKLQTYITLSTIHAEYVALSQSLRDMLPFKVLAKETLKGLGLNIKNIKGVTQWKVFEDNAGAIVVSSSSCLTPTSKFIDVKYN